MQPAKVTTEKNDRAMWMYSPGYKEFTCSHCGEQSERRYKTCPACGREMLNGW